MSENEIVLNVLVDADGNELNILTSFVERDVTIVRKMRVPLYVDGQLKSAEELAELGLVVKGYTQAELDQRFAEQCFAANPQLAVRLRQYKALLLALGLETTATSDEVKSAILSAPEKTDAEKSAMASEFLALMHDIELNWSEVGEDGFSAWENLPKLLTYLPEE